MSRPRSSGPGLLLAAGAVVACCGLKVVVLAALAGAGGVAIGNVALVAAGVLALVALGVSALRRARLGASSCDEAASSHEAPSSHEAGRHG